MALRAGARLLARQASAALACQGGWAAPCCACADALGRRGREWAGPQASSAGARQLRVAAWPRAAVEIKVASFGESMTEGTVAEVLKQRGDSVAEDTVILQIDTDKVTMDVRAPEGGVIDSILVKPDDVVTVGQLVAVLRTGEDASAPAKPAAAEKPAAATEPEPAAQPALAAPAPPPPHQGPPEGGRARIAFPPRRTPDGARISALPAEEQARYLGGGAEPAAPQAAAAPAAAPAPPAGAADAAAAQRPRTPWYVGKERGTKLSQSRVLTEREMELIDLGGAAP